MWACPSCGASNPEGHRFCAACGTARSTLRCAACDSAVGPGDRFCGACGAPLAARPAPAPGADGGPTLSVPAAAAAPAGGAVATAPGNGGGRAPARAEAAAAERKLATIVFADVVGFTGYAEAADPEAVGRRITAALGRCAAIVEEHGGTVDKYLGDALMAVFGVPTAHEDDAERAVAAALAICGSGGDLRFSVGVNTGEVLVTSMPNDERVTVLGDAVNVASRLEDAAGAGDVLAGPLTAELAGQRVAFRPRGSVMLAGRTEPVRVFEAVELRQSAEDGGSPPLVGREDELGFLLARWRRCTEERVAEALLLVGEVGVGKTRLLDEVASRAAAVGTVVRATYPSYGALAGARVVRRLLETLGATGEPALDARLRSLAGEAVDELADLDAAAVEQEQLRALRTLVTRRAAERPLLVLLDEVQWANDRTLRLLGDVVRRVEAPLLVVLAGRPEPDAWLSRLLAPSRLRLEALPPAAAATLAAALVAEGTLAPETAALLAERGAGNPLHVRELVRLVRDQGGLVGGHAGLELRGGLTLPPSLHAILSARLDALPPDHKGLLQVAAVLGGEVRIETLAALGVAAPHDAVRALLRGGLLRDRSDGRVEVADPLLRDVAYEGLTREARVALHRRAAALADRDEDRARHLEWALACRPDDQGLRAETAAALDAAGRELIELRRPREAEAALRRALSLGLTDPKPWLRLAQLLVEVGADDEALAVLDEVPVDGAGPEGAEATHVRANAETRRRPLAAVALYEEAEQRWAGLGDTTKVGWALANRAVALTLAGRLGEASRLMRRALAHFEALGALDGVFAARQFLGVLHPEDPQVEGWMEEGLRHAQRTGDLVRERHSRQSLVWHHFLRSMHGGPDEVRVAVGHAEALATLSDELDDAVGSTYGHALAALLLRGAGELERCAVHASRARDLRLGAGSGATVLRDAAVATADLLAVPDAPLPASLGTPHDITGVIGVAAAGVAAALAGRQADVDRLLSGLTREPAEVTVVHALSVSLLGALRLVLCGAPEEAESRLVGAAAAADTARAGPSATVARALLAECRAAAGDVDAARGLLAAVPEQSGGIAGALVARARALTGDQDAACALDAAADRLRAPALRLRAAGAPPTRP